MHSPVESTSAHHGYALMVHGGAGTLSKDGRSASEAPAFRAKLLEALAAGERVLRTNGSSLDAVTAVIRVLEDAPEFNAGHGAVLNADGYAELDSSIMEGRTKHAGAVAGVHRIKNPILAARAVMEKTPHVLLVADGADAFAAQQGLEIVPPEYFITDFQRQQWEKEKAKRMKQARAKLPLDVFEPSSRKSGTVGAVALDRAGNLAAGTSTGGMSFKRPGRVGDSPIIGAGTYADNQFCAISCSGHGEYFIRYSVTRDITDLMDYRGMTLQRAADLVIKDKLVKAGGEGGMIGLDRHGHPVCVYNSPGMFHGAVEEGKSPWVVVQP